MTSFRKGNVKYVQPFLVTYDVQKEDFAVLQILGIIVSMKQPFLIFCMHYSLHDRIRSRKTFLIVNMNCTKVHYEKDCS